MKRFGFLLLVATGLAASPAFAADMATKAPAAPAAPSLWDVVVTAALMSDYNFRGITQSNHKPSTQGGFELRYNFNKSLQAYAGASGESISFPNMAAGEIDLYGGIRPTFNKLALDFGIWEYYYPGGKCFNPAAAACGGGPYGGAFVPGTAIGFPGGMTGNVVKADESFVEFYAKAAYTVNDNLSLGLQEWYSPSASNTGAYGWFTTGNATVTLPSAWFSNGWGGYVSGDLGYWDLGTSDAFYGFTKYTSYGTWDAGFGWTWKVLTFDLRYYDTNLTRSECNAFTSPQSVSFSPGNITTQNPNGLGTNWCGAAFIAKLSASIDFNTNLK
ncbi:MAG: TorF family putative porin [Xanthobacteraceae bacterium]